MNVHAVAPNGAPSILAADAPPAGRPFHAILADAIDAADAALGNADGKAAALAAGHGSVIDASLARAKADVLLEIVSVTASRVGAAINTLLQTQV